MCGNARGKEKDMSEILSVGEGDLKAWLVVFGAWCAMVPSMGLLNTLAKLQLCVLHPLPT